MGSYNFVYFAYWDYATAKKNVSRYRGIILVTKVPGNFVRVNLDFCSYSKRKASPDSLLGGFNTHERAKHNLRLHWADIQDGRADLGRRTNDDPTSILMASDFMVTRPIRSLI